MHGSVVVRTPDSQSRETGFESTCCRFENLLIFVTPRCHSCCCINTAAVAIPSSNTVGCKRTFLQTASSFWNKLPEKIVGIKETDQFKAEVNTFLGTLCQHPSPECRQLLCQGRS